MSPVPSYVRVGPRSSSGLGNLRFVSFNTWLIVINVVVFILNNWVLSAPGLQVRVSFGDEYVPGVTKEQIARGQVLTTKTGTHPTVPGWLSHPIIDPQTPETNPQGLPVVAIENGKIVPRYKQIGRERFGAMPALEAIGHLSTGKGFIPGFQVWRFVTFQFLHYNEVHLLLNMLGLWFAGGMVEQFLGSKRYAAFYLVCGICGGLMYLLLNFLGYLVVHVLGLGTVAIPGLLFNDIYTPLIGASAGVFGVLIAAARIEPNAMVRFMFVIPMRLRTAVAAMVLVTLFNLFTGRQNAGGEAAHVGGILAGFYFIRNTHLLRDFFDIIGNSHRPDRRMPAPSAEWLADEARVDGILTKAHQGGSESLTEEERQILHRVARRQYG
jgi:membrane associated rhomboid family serine protease